MIDPKIGDGMVRLIALGVIAAFVVALSVMIAFAFALYVMASWILSK